MGGGSGPKLSRGVLFEKRLVQVTQIIRGLSWSGNL